MTIVAETRNPAVMPSDRRRTTRYRALRREELSRLLAEAGFTTIRWEGPERVGPDFAPLVTARNPPS